MRKAVLQNALNDIKAFVDVKVSEQINATSLREGRNFHFHQMNYQADSPVSLKTWDIK
jgi:hypothetical protein